MKTFEIVDFNESEICVKSRKELEELYLTITKDEEDFILSDGNESKVVLANQLLGKIKAGEILLTSRED